MKIKILRGDRGKWYYNTDNIGKEFRDIEYIGSSSFRFLIKGSYWVDKDDCVITELPESFCVKRCDDNNRDDWNKYLQWLNKQKNYPIPMFGGVDRYKYYGVNGENLHSDYLYPFGTEIHIDDIIKHIDFYSEPMAIESKEEKKMETNLLELIRLFPELPTDYAKELVVEALKVKNGNLIDLSKFINNAETTFPTNYDIIPGNRPDNKADYVWRKIYDFKNNKMETQKLSRAGLKEIHSVACSSWKSSLELLGASNPLEDYIELNQDQIDAMFKACTSSQLPIVSKYLKQDDGSVDLSNIKYDKSGARVDGIYILRHDDFDASDNNSFWLNNDYDWILKVVKGDQRLYPTKKKQSLTSSVASTAVGVASTATGYTNSTTGKYSVGF
jgi:hypothetical protein